MADAMDTHDSQTQSTQTNEPLINFNNYYSIFRHPNKNCMSFSEHAKLSLTFSGKLLLGSVKAFIHAFVPDAYSKSTTDLIKEIDNMINEAGCNKPELRDKDV